MHTYNTTQLIDSCGNHATLGMIIGFSIIFLIIILWSFFYNMEAYADGKISGSKCGFRISIPFVMLALYLILS